MAPGMTGTGFPPFRRASLREGSDTSGREEDRRLGGRFLAGREVFASRSVGSGTCLSAGADRQAGN